MVMEAALIRGQLLLLMVKNHVSHAHFNNKTYLHFVHTASVCILFAQYLCIISCLLILGQTDLPHPQSNVEDNKSDQGNLIKI